MVNGLIRSFPTDRIFLALDCLFLTNKMGNVAAGAAGQIASALPIPGFGGGDAGDGNTHNTDVGVGIDFSDIGNTDVDINVPIDISIGSDNNVASNNISDSEVTEDSNNTVNSNNKWSGVEDNCPQLEGNKKRWAWFNCGVDKPNCKNVFLSSEYETREKKRDINIAGEKEAFRWWGRSHVWSKTCIEYTVNVKKPASYDVTLVFAENYKGCFGDGKRVFDVELLTDDQECNVLKDLDVYVAAGPKQYYTHTFWDVDVENDIKIRLKKGKAENPMISGIFIHGPN